FCFSSCVAFLFSLCAPAPRALPSFPTRRSSDLVGGRLCDFFRRRIHPGTNGGDGPRRGCVLARAGGCRRRSALSGVGRVDGCDRSEEHTSELQSLTNLVCRLLLEKKNKQHSSQH